MIPSVSVIVPIYNASTFLVKCLSSLREQTFTNWECLLINDGSTDDSENICKEYCAVDQRFYLYTKQNEGPSAARNYGIERSKGKYIYFLDSDDYLENDLLLSLYSEMENGFDMVSCNYIREDVNGCVLRYSNFPSIQYVFSTIEDKCSFLCKKLTNYQCGTELWNRLFRRDVISEFNIRFNSRSIMGEDMFFIIMYVLVTKKYLVIKAPSYHYVKHENALTNKMPLDKKVAGTLSMVEDLKRFVDRIERGNPIHYLLYPLYVKLYHFEIADLLKVGEHYVAIAKMLNVIEGTENHQIFSSFTHSWYSIKQCGMLHYLRYNYDSRMLLTGGSKLMCYTDYITMKVYISIRSII